MKDYFGRPVRDSFPRVMFRRDGLAETLWEYGEGALAERALSLSDEELYEVQVIAAWHHVNDPEPDEGPRLSLARIVARAGIEFLEGQSRDTTRRRRRTRPREQRFTAAFDRSLQSDEPADLGTPAEAWVHWAPEVRLRPSIASRIRSRRKARQRGAS
jgi:hypothetical protein